MKHLVAAILAFLISMGIANTDYQSKGFWAPLQSSDIVTVLLLSTGLYFLFVFLYNQFRKGKKSSA